MNLNRQKNIRKRHKRPFLSVLFEVLGHLLGVVIFGYLTFVSLRVAFDTDYVQIFGIILGFIFGLITLYIVVLLFYCIREKDIMSVSWVIGINKKKWILARYFLTFFAVMGFITSVNVFKNRDEQNDFVGITITQTNDSKIQESSLKRKRSITIFSKEYPNYCFQIDDVYMKYMNSYSYENNVKCGDTLTVMITQESYDKKIAKTKSLSFTDKTMNYHLICICGLKHKNFELLSTIDYNREKKIGSVVNALLFFVGGICCLFLQLFTYEQENET